jgi:5-methylcytosine-specific restriction protein A
MPGDEWDIEHIIALINGGEHREANMAPALRIAHPEKTARDMKTKSKIARTRKRHVGIKSRKGRPMPGTKASGIRKRMSGQVERW